MYVYCCCIHIFALVVCYINIHFGQAASVLIACVAYTQQTAPLTTGDGGCSRCEGTGRGLCVCVGGVHAGEEERCVWVDESL